MAEPKYTLGVGHTVAFEDRTRNPPVWRLGMVTKTDGWGKALAIMPSGENRSKALSVQPYGIRTIPDPGQRKTAAQLAHSMPGQSWESGEALKAAILAFF